jgi:hypothetical protein
LIWEEADRKKKVETQPRLNCQGQVGEKEEDANTNSFNASRPDPDAKGCLGRTRHRAEAQQNNIAMMAAV